ncbi:cell division protein ZipA C-terminal FtsZ-binding domain-containing protein [Moraxella catarrhalis]|uniref:cell division protein ZipA C-terminal FtsZ-binding domain-containing protein n=1 Tax=Moraxella catarrhalis TaxID=480 RepID=UPI0007E3D576|nr:cell division protein ZipA C-terminal FtsZ-binding domain-containing protein [Moraxella catarrhalis]OAV24830.1 Cell division protein ZipA [Moraxella catarrhalis]
MQWSGLWLILALMVVILGVFFVMRNLRRNNLAPESEALGVKTKYGLPIIPRDERVLPSRVESSNKKVEPEDALSSMAAAVAAAPVMSQTSHAQMVDKPLKEDNKVNQANTQARIDVNSQDQDSIRINNPSDGLSHAQDWQAYDENQDADYVVDMTFDKRSAVLDEHLDERRAFDQNNDPLLNATETVSVAIMPRNSFAGLPGRTVLEIVRTYGMKYGVMNLFHRYENEDGTGDLWFSMMGVGYEGVCAFDLNSLPESHFMGLTLFLALPHPHALRGFDSMVSVAHMIAQDLSADILDEQGNLFDDTYFAKLRSVVAEHNAN